jgi:uncharacterized protein YndB with AHSA1/START domain
VTGTRWTRDIRAPRSSVYAALLDPAAVQQWMVPDGMTSRVHWFEAKEGGGFRISLTYDAPTGTGKTTAQTDTFEARFERLVPDSEVVQLVEFETDDPQMQGEMKITYRLTDTGIGTQLTATHEGLPPGLSPADNDLGWNSSLDKLTHLVEGL